MQRVVQRTTGPLRQQLSQGQRLIHSSTPALNRADLYELNIPIKGEPSIQLGGRCNVNGVVATVFGSTGLLGRGVVELLGQCGSQVVCPYRDDGMESRSLKLNGDLGQIVPVPYDFSEIDTVRDSVQRSNVTINCIGNNHETKNYNFHDANVKTAYRLAKVSKEAGVERFIHVSANGASYDSDSDFLKAKAESEDWVREVYPDAVIVRPCNMWGSRDKYLNRLADAANVLPFVPVVGWGAQKVTPVFYGDVAEAIRNIVLDPSTDGKIFELGGPKVMTNKEVVDMVVRDIYRDPGMVLPVPPSLSGWVGFGIEQLPARWKFLTADMVKQEMEDNVPSGHYGNLKDLDVKGTDVTVSARNVLMLHARTRSPSKYGMRDDIVDENDWYRA